MSTFVTILTYSSGAAVAGVVATLIACGLRRWPVVVTMSRATVVAGVATLVASLTALLALSSGVGAATNPAEKANLLSAGVSELMNGGALACLAAICGAILWPLGRWRLRAKKPAG